MSAIDLDVLPGGEHHLSEYLEMAELLGFSHIGVRRSSRDQQISGKTRPVTRIDLEGRSLVTLKQHLVRVRHSTLVVGLPLRGIESANWAAEDTRVDLLTLEYPQKDTGLRSSTARLAAQFGTALEVPVLPLLVTDGLQRSKIIKVFSESIQTALGGNMGIVLSSGADLPLRMRSPLALQHIGILLGLETHVAKAAVRGVPKRIIDLNSMKLEKSYLGSGLEIVRGGSET
jgi:RNase P/RNase MRP subunit p30